MLNRLISFISIPILLLTIRGLIRQTGKEQPISKISPIISIVLSMLMLVLNIIFLRKANPSFLGTALLIFGIGLGIPSSRSTKLKINQGRLIGKRSILYLIFWGISYAVTQLLSLFAPAAVVASGLSAMFFSTGVTFGTNGDLLYRMRRISTGRLPALTHTKVNSVEESTTDLTIESDEKTIPQKNKKDKQPKKKTFRSVILRLAGLIAFLVIASIVIVRFLFVDLLSSIRIKIGDSQISFSLPHESQDQVTTQESAQEDTSATIESAQHAMETESTPTPPLEENEVTETFIISEDFNSNAGKAVPLFSDDFMRYYHAEGKGVIENSGFSGILPILFPNTKVKNFIAEFDFMMPESPDDSGCGIIFRADPEFSDGLDIYYALFLYPKANIVRMSIWLDNQMIQSPLVNPKPTFRIGDEFNHIRLEVKEVNMRVFLNDAFVMGFDEDTHLKPGLIGLFLFPSPSIAEGNSDYVFYDNLKVTEN